MKSARWTAIRQITPRNRLEAGRELFNLQCLSCHTIGGVRNDVVARLQPYTYQGILSLLTGQGRVQSYMPEFVGTWEEKEALAAYLAEVLLDREVVAGPAASAIDPLPEEIPSFDQDEDEYVLLVWNDLGMHGVSDSDPWFVILPPGNTLEAQLIKRGETPELISEGVELSYQVEPGFANPAGHVEFWKYAGANFSTTLPENMGLAGKGMSGTFRFAEERGSFIAEAIPVLPYRDDGVYIPYPIFAVEARDTENGEVLMCTKVVAPVSTEMGCRNCHGGGWRVKGVAGMADETAINLLEVHDRISDTDLYAAALEGRPQRCQRCHVDAALGTEGDPELLNFSAAMHGWHANYLPYGDARDCVLCHSGYRGVHNTLILTCVECHGTMHDHALALLKAEGDKGSARRLMAHLRPRSAASVEAINPRSPWVQQPDCLTCHQEFEPPEPGASGFNVWNEDAAELYRMRTDEAGIRCPACHGATHALYPAANLLGGNRDNLQPMQYAGMSYPIGANLSCEVCHQMEMEDSVHHENMEHMFRNAALVK